MKVVLRCQNQDALGSELWASPGTSHCQTHGNPSADWLLCLTGPVADRPRRRVRMILQLCRGTGTLAIYPILGVSRPTFFLWQNPWRGPAAKHEMFWVGTRCVLPAQVCGSQVDGRPPEHCPRAIPVLTVDFTHFAATCATAELELLVPRAHMHVLQVRHHFLWWIIWIIRNKIQGVSFELERWFSKRSYPVKHEILPCETEVLSGETPQFH